MTTTDTARTDGRVVLRVLSDGEHVVNHSLVVRDGAPSAVRFDLWRIADHKVVQHWADEEDWAPRTANGHTQIDGTSAVDNGADAAQTRETAEAAVRRILVNGDASALGELLAGEAYVQHNPRFADGVSGLVAALSALAEQGIAMKYDGVRQVVVQGDFAYFRSEGSFADRPFVFHDLFRVSGGQCVEHWDVMVPRA